MTTPEPRVRVTIEREEYDGQSEYVANWTCPCGVSEYLFGVPVSVAHDEARAHAATCLPLRLACKERQWAEFVRELEALRDDYAQITSDVQADMRSSSFRTGLGAAYRNAADDLTAILGRLG